MSEWTAPGGSGPEREQPRYGELAPAGWTPPAQDPANPHGPVPPTAPPAGFTPPPPYTPYGAPTPQGRSNAGWTPPPKPGLLPLRPLTLGDVLGATFRVIRRNPRPTLGFSVMYNVLLTVVVGLIGWFVITPAFSRLDFAAAGDRDTILDGSILVSILTTLAASILTGSLVGIVEGVIALDVTRETIGEKPGLRTLLAATRGRRWALIGWTLLESVASMLGLGILFLVFIAFLPLGPILGPVLGALVAMLGGLLFVVLSAWISTKLAFVPALLVVERLPMLAAFRRSWSLTGGHFWRIFGILLLVSLIVTVGAEIVTIPVELFTGLFSTFINPNQGVDGATSTVIASMIASYAVSALVQSVILVAQAAAPTVLYLDVRMRKEGLDLELQHWTEQQAAGQSPPDPYRRG